MEFQQYLHTQPDNGSSSTALQTAHSGASTAATNPFPNVVISDLGWGTRGITRIARYSSRMPFKNPGIWDQ